MVCFLELSQDALSTLPEIMQIELTGLHSSVSLLGKQATRVPLTFTYFCLFTTDALPEHEEASIDFAEGYVITN